MQSALVAALTDAVNDGMDVVTLSMSEGDPATYAPLDVDPSCADSSGDTHCDVRVEAVENAVKLGMVVVTAAGNDGYTAPNYPTLNSIHTPGTAPDAITVGASMNSHVFYQAVHVNGRGRAVEPAEHPRPVRQRPPSRASARAAPRCDPIAERRAGVLGLPAGSLTGAIALVQRGTCLYSNKVIDAQNAGAVGVVIYRESRLGYAA
jgi:minor extracellular serine protease Vpr